MPFATEVDAFLAKVQARVEEVMAEARTDLTEMVAGAEKELSEFQQRFREGFCADADDPSNAAPSQTETTPKAPEEGEAS